MKALAEVAEPGPLIPPLPLCSLCFSPDGQQLLAGYNKCMLVFDVTRPGREYTKIVTYVKRRQENLPGEGKARAPDLGGLC